MRRSILAALAILPLLSAPAHANDSAAVLGGGGLVFTAAPGISMLSEDLRIGRDEIRVRYEFLNRTDREISLRVAFPLPEIDHARLGMSPVNVIEGTTPDNFVGFTVTVDGKAVTPEFEARAFLGKAEVTQDLAKHGILMSLFHGRALEDRLKALPRPVRDDLARRKLFEQIGDDEFLLNWTYRAAFHWTQSFPPGRPVVVEHRYAPVAGGTFLGPDSLKAPDRQEELWAPYCIDASTRRGIESLMKSSSGGYAWGVWIDYVLKTARSWDGPIGRFTLTLDKGKPDSILSVCLDGVRKTSPTTFVVERNDFRPDRDLRVLILDRIQAP